MSIYTNPPEWEAQGKKPPSSKRAEGWKPGDRVPASWLNWFWFSTVNSLREIAGAFVSHRDATSGVHGVPEGETIATARYVDEKLDAHMGETTDTVRYVDGKLDAHIADKNNPHSVTKSQVGLGNVENYGIATQAEAEAGSVNNKYMTPLRVAQAIAALHANATSGIHGATSSATANRLVIRDSAGRAQFATPSAAADAATKGYVDSLFSAVRAHVQTGEYNGNGAINRHIFLGWMPFFVVIMTTYESGGNQLFDIFLRINTAPYTVRISSQSASNAVIEPPYIVMTDSGFTVSPPYTNESGRTYYYVAFG